MKHPRWTAALIAMVAILLLVEGAWTVRTIDAVRGLEIFPDIPFATAENVAWAKSYLPAMYVVAIEGLLFGSVAVIVAIGMLMGKHWAVGLLRIASVLLALTAMMAICMAPYKWDTQGIFIVLCILSWWGSRKWHINWELHSDDD